jgi:cysteine-rich repeat protein
MAAVRWWLIVGVLAALPAAAAAADHPIEGDRLRLRDTGDPSRRVARFRAVAEPAIDLATFPDPRLGGATLEIVGTAPGDGSSGAIALDASLWRGLGDPPGSRGYRYVDRDLTTGVRRVDVRGGAPGGRLVISARGANWPFVVQQPQEQIEVRLTVAGEIYCAEFSGFDFRRNAPPVVLGRFAPPPPDCALPVCGNGVLESPEECDDGGLDPGDGCDSLCDTEPVCGNGIVEGIEECDDGGIASGDGCSASCELEDVTAICAGIPMAPGTAIKAVLIAQGLDNPVNLAAPRLDPGRIFVLEQRGFVRVIEHGVLLPTPFLDVTSKVQCAPACGERGLLGLAFHPDYESNGRFFLNYTNTAGDTVVARYAVSDDPNAADGASEQIVLTVAQPFANHNGGHIAFGPDGHLYIALGDGGGIGDPQENGQSDSTLLGKLLRLDVEVETSPYYAVPPSNPNPGAGDPLGLVWAKGFRNPWRFSFDRATGDLYVGDVGQDAREEVDYQPAASAGGENYGWNIMEGTRCYDPPPHFSTCGAAAPFLMPPVHEYGHAAGGCSITGGFVYRGCRLPDLHGAYFFADFCTGRIETFEVVGGVSVNHQNRTADLDPPGPLKVNSISSFGEDARGELYIIDRTGEIFRVEPD